VEKLDTTLATIYTATLSICQMKVGSMSLDELRKQTEARRDVHLLMLERNAALLDAACLDLGVSRGAVIDRLIEDSLGPVYGSAGKKKGGK
jgi:hypothetical protein